MKKIGIIGGLGPIATAHLYKLIVDLTDATIDQDHLEVIIYSNPKVPDRTKYILDNNLENPLPYLINIGHKLEKMGADFLAMPCITGHHFYNELNSSFKIPIINMIDQLTISLNNNKIKKIGLLATKGTIYSKLFQKSLEKYDIEVVLPNTCMQNKIMDIIYKQIKANKEIDYISFMEVLTYFKKNKTDNIILGCTELSLIKTNNIKEYIFWDCLEVLAKKSIIYSGGKIKQGGNIYV